MKVAPDMTQIRRVLLIKLSAFGDVVHALPVSAALGEAYPHLEITWAVEEPFAPLVTGNPYLKEVFTLPKLKLGKLSSADYRREYGGQLQRLNASPFDLSLDLQGLTKSAIVAMASGAKIRLGYHWLREAARLVERPVPRRPESVHIVEQYLDVARYLGAEPTSVQFPLVVPPEDASIVQAMLCEGGISPERPFVAVNPATAQVIKNWGAAHYAAVMDTLQAEFGLAVVLVTADKAVAKLVEAAAQRPFLNLAGRTNLKQLTEVLRLSTLHLCGDTGSSHLAAALGRPVITLVGPTDPDRIYPYGQPDHVLSRREQCDARCDWHHCALGAPRCLAAITVADVLAKLRTILS